MIEIELSNRHPTSHCDSQRLISAAQRVLRDAGIQDGNLSIAVVDDATIHELNRRYLDHDYATDVLSFVLEERPRWLSGEVIVSADTADRTAKEYGWTVAEELLLYVIHGSLHLVGYDDHSDADRREMRACEQAYLKAAGVAMPAESATATRSRPASSSAAGEERP